MENWETGERPGSAAPPPGEVLRDRPGLHLCTGSAVIYLIMLTRTAFIIGHLVCPRL